MAEGREAGSGAPGGVTAVRPHSSARSGVAAVWLHGGGRPRVSPALP